MVRVGGGWMALDEFLVKNDPCRGKFDTIAGGNMFFRYMEKRFPETLLQDSIILIPLKTFLIFAHHLSLMYSFSSMSVLIFSVLSEFTFISSSITSPLLPDLFPMVVIFICMAYTFGPFFLSLSLSPCHPPFLFYTIIVHGACSLGLSLPLSLPRPLSLFVSPQCNIQDLKSCVLTPAAPYHLA